MAVATDDLDRLSKARLRAEARLRGLPDGGSRHALIERLRGHEDDDPDDDELRVEHDDEPDEPRDDDVEDEDDDQPEDEDDDEPRDEDEPDEDDDEPDEPRDEEDEDDDEPRDGEVQDEDDDQPRDEDDDLPRDDDLEVEDEDDDEDDEPRADVGDAQPDQEEGRDDADGSSPNGHRRKAGTSRFGRLVTDARETLEGLVGRRIDAVSGIEPTDEGFVVTLEVLEVQRVPETTDVLATYEVQLDDDGELMSFAKTRRYYRNQQLGD